MTDDMTEIFTTGDAYDDTAYSREDCEELEAEGCGKLTRYVREDLCYEKSKIETVLTKQPLFDDIITDPAGNVWVKIPVKIKVEQP